MILLFSWLHYLSQKSGDLDFVFENLGHFLTMKKKTFVHVEVIFFKSNFFVKFCYSKNHYSQQSKTTFRCNLLVGSQYCLKPNSANNLAYLVIYLFNLVIQLLKGGFFFSWKVGWLVICSCGFASYDVTQFVPFVPMHSQVE
jgi:hypothetical protein